MKQLNLQESYTFSQYFDLKIIAKDLSRMFGYQFDRQWLTLPQYDGQLDRLQETKDRIEEILPYVSLSNEAARREILIAPIIIDLVHYTKVEVNIEYPIKVTEQLQGTLDYFLAAAQRVLIVEAKKEDLDFGLTQLCAALIALDEWLTDTDQTQILGGVTTGKLWEFAQLDRPSKHITQGLGSYRVPEDLEPLLRILVHALMGGSDPPD